MDLSVFEVAPQGAVLQILHPVSGQPLTLDDGTAVTVTMVGMDSDEWRAHQQAITDRQLERRTPRKITAADIENETLQGLALCIKSWTGMVKAGKAFDCTPQNAVKLLRELPHFRRQVETFLLDGANFLTVSRKA